MHTHIYIEYAHVIIYPEFNDCLLRAPLVV